ncbi:Sorting nexin-14 [Nibea albiflora]|uniref:Sorting nexin-14 n=1 Tax=Nibea albiflora TaxID=240163 RepID=A0ACB7FAL3_NIBAL|nr:Sorting nexin-14 [Nibea albiflora]
MPASRAVANASRYVQANTGGSAEHGPDSKHAVSAVCTYHANLNRGWGCARCRSAALKVVPMEVPVRRMAGVLRFLRRGLKLDVLREAGRQYPLFCFVLLSMLSMTVLLNRYIHVLMVFWSFLAGVITFYCSIGPDTLLPNIFFSVKPRNKRQEQELFPLGHSCAVCGKVKCKRHRPTLLLENYQPWLDLKVHSNVDASIAEVFELVLENFVYPWYRDITDDEACVDELRMTFRFFASVLVRRAQKIDVPAVFAGKVMKAAMKHIEVIAKARAKVKNSEALQQAALDEYGADLHIALRSRKDELLYLRKLTEMLSLALLLREVMAGSVMLPTMDFMADPDTVNLMVLIFVDDTPKYADVSNKKPSVLKLELKEIREQQDLLFRFMNFLKQEGAVHVLQFCLTVEEFNDKILSPELSDAELQRLHGEVLHIYETYCLDESIDKISFDKLIVEEIKNIAKGPYSGVVKLQTMRCLFEAYEHVLSLLERVFTPMFCHSDEHHHPYIDSYDDEAKREKIPVFCIDVERHDRKEGERPLTSELALMMSALSVMMVFLLVSVSVGHEVEKWSIYRRYLEFYVLESKLTEFHGTFADAQLPSKRIIGPKNYEFLASKREEFEEYLQLSNSQLLADFLSPYSMESQFLDRMLPDVNLGKIFKSVPGKLIKEKGQNLEPFIQSFFNSCESPKPKPSRPELTILSPSAENNKKLFSDLFKNNANLSESLEQEAQPQLLHGEDLCGRHSVSLRLPGRTVFHISDWLHHVLAAGRIVLKSSFEAYMDQYMQLKLEQILQEHHMVSLITQLRDFVGKCIGDEAKYEGIRFLFDGLQQPLLNKQMTYVLLDIAVQELFPELTKVMRDEDVA